MSLVEGLKRDQEQLDPATVENFVRHGTAVPKLREDEPQLPTAAPEKPRPQRQDPEPQPATQAAVMTPGLIPVNVRVRPEIAAALKTAALQRELQGAEPFTKREIVEQALEPWLKKNGYL